ncbi:hypothetical protein CHS0354_039343 [Potamilus streckersoni]|nr:hypothetical protein CHS0354_039343 [Potamilus streckersoni]
MISTDFSQLQNIQSEMSQYSQDFFNSQSSQQLSGESSQTESQGKCRPAIYEKYMSKSSLFRSSSQGKTSGGLGPSVKLSGSHDHTTHIPAQKASSMGLGLQQQVQINKYKAKERDEKDNFDVLLNLVRDCSDTMKQSFNILKDQVMEHTNAAGSSIGSSMNKMLECLEATSKRILQELQVQDKKTSEISDMQKEISKKDSQVHELLTHLSEQQKHETENIVDSFKSFFLEQESCVEQKMKKVLASTAEHCKQASEQMKLVRSANDEQTKQFQDLKYTIQRQFQDNEKRILDELMQLRDHFDKQKHEMENFYRSQLQLMHQKQSRDLEMLMYQGIERGAQLSAEKIQDLLLKQQTDLKDCYRNQNIDLKSYLRSQEQEQTEHLLQRYDEICNKVVTKHAEEKMEIHRYIKKLEDQKQRAESLNIQTCPLQNTAGKEYLTADYIGSSDVIKGSCFSGNQPNQNLQSKLISVFPRSSILLSPRPNEGMAWNSAALFGKTNPSPVATVLPQRINKEIVESETDFNTRRREVSRVNAVQTINIKPNSDISASEDKSARMLLRDKTLSIDSSSIPVNNRQSAKQTNQDTKRKSLSGSIKQPSKRRKRQVKPKRRTEKHKFISEKRPASQTQLSSNISSADIYDFKDDTLPEPVNKPASRFGVMSCSKSSDVARMEMLKWTPGSPTNSDDSSSNSSPSISVTEVFIRRKVRCERRTPEVTADNRNSGGRNSGKLIPSRHNDFLATPNLLEKCNIDKNDSLAVKWDVSKPCVQGPTYRRLGEKRKLCDFDTEITEIRKSFSQYQERRERQNLT